MFRKIVLILMVIVASFGDEYIIKKIKDGGIIRNISIPISKYRDNRRVGIIVKFNSNKIDLERFQSTYSLKFIEKLSIGYYIFSNHSTFSDIDLVGNIIEKERDIKTIKVNNRLRPKIL